MTSYRLLVRSLTYYRHTALAVAVGLGLATAAVTGALVVGDSMRGSLRDIALSRLGKIHCAITAPRYFRDALAADLMAHPGVSATVKRLSPVLVSQGAARNVETGSVTPEVTVLAVDADFSEMWRRSGFPRLAGRQCAISDALARDLGVRAGDALLVTVYRQGEVSSHSLFARRRQQDVAPSLRLHVASVLPVRGPGEFRLDTENSTPRNLFISRDWLSEQLGLVGKANTLVAAVHPSRRPEACGALTEALRTACTLDDHGLALTSSPLGTHLSLTTPAMSLSEAHVQAARAAAAECGARAALTSVYLATRIGRLGDPKGPELAYAVVAGLEPLQPWPGGLGARSPSQKGIWLNEWAARALHCSVGEVLQISYLVPTPEGAYPTAHLRLTVEAIVPLAGPAKDTSLVPEFEGITDAESIHNWDPPFPIDLRRVTPADEDYWDRYRATPKAFVNLATVRAMWRTGPGGQSRDWITSVRIAPNTGADLDSLRVSFQKALLKHVTPEASRIRVIPIRELALKASRGTSDFGQLFLGLSMFLVASAVGLAAMVMRLSVAQRASHAGIMLACGWKRRRVSRVLFTEGAALTVAGAVAGVPLGVVYAQALIGGLTTWWRGALGATPALWLHVEPKSLITGGLCGIVAGLAATGSSVRQLHRRQVLDLLAGWQAMAVAPETGRGWPAIATLIVTLGGGVALLAMTLGERSMRATAAFFGLGTLLLMAGLAALALALRRLRRPGGATRSPIRLALRNAAAASGRSLLTAGLLASASFVIVATGANTRDLSGLDVTRRDSGAGGFSLHAVSSVPLPFDPATPEGRANLGFAPEDESQLEGVEIVSFLASPGEDVSCLNLARPRSPRLIGVPDALLKRGGFSVITAEKTGAGSPWDLLTRREPDGAIPVFGDAASVRWSLHSGLGQTYTTPTGKLRFRGLLPGSIFARELLISEASFRAMFPEITAPSYFLVATPPGREEAVAELLRRNLGEMGLRVRTTRSLLNDFLRVQNAYISVFVILGGLGLLLGTAGLGATLMRSAMERRKELALLLAVGHTRAAVGRLLLLENGSLLISGLVWGTLSALVAVAPHLASVEASVNWGALVTILAGVLVVGYGTCLIALRAALQGELVAALRRE